jgi:FKBP-type peptidyl-prolyl cis-trans isomerase
MEKVYIEEKSLLGDNEIVKKMISKGEDEIPVEDGQTVGVIYEGRLEDGTVFDATSKHPGQKPLEFAIGQGSVIKGWDIGIKAMYLGEVAELFI